MNEIKLYGKIGTDITDKRFINELSYLSGDVKLSINSPGGSVFHGYAMYNAIKEYDRGTIIAHIDGVAASMASVICLAGDKVIMAGNAMYMIHNPSSNGGRGQSKDLRKEADLLDKIKSVLVEAYLSKTNIDKEELNIMLDEETWLTSDEALKLGFVDEIKNSTLKKLTGDLEIDPIEMYECFKLNNSEPMNKELLKLLKLKENATEKDVMEAVKKLLPKDEKPNDKDVKNVINKGLKEKKFTSELVPHLTGLLENDFNGTKELIGNMRSMPKLSSKINRPKKDKSNLSKDRSKWTLDDYRKHDPQALRSQPSLYKELYEAEFNDVE